MNRTGSLALASIVLAGTLFGAWLAAEVGGRGAPREALGCDASEDAATRAEAPRASPAVDPELARPAVEPRRGPERPRPDPRDPRWAASADEAGFAAWVQDGVAAGVTVQLAAFAWVDDRPRFPALARGVAESNGLAYLRARHAGPLAIVALAPGFEPVLVRVEAEPGAQVELEPIVFQRGATIRGRVTAGGTPLVRAEIQATLDAPGDPAGLEDLAVGWRNGRCVWSRASANTDADGRYELSGLAEDAHTLRIATVRRHDMAIDALHAEPRRARAPRADVDFALPAARIDLAFQSHDAPLCCVEVQVQAGDRHFMRTTDEAGRLSIAISPALAYPLTAAHGGYATKRTQLRGLVDGERLSATIELERQATRATLLVDDRGAGQSTEARLAFAPRFQASRGEAFERTVTRRAGETQFRVENVPAGSWRVTLRSGRRMGSVIDGRTAGQVWSNCDVDFFADVPDTGVVTVTPAVTPRGHLQITVRDAQGRRVSAQCELRDLRGEPIESAILSSRVQDQGLPILIASSEPDPPIVLFAAQCMGVADLIVTRAGSRPQTVRVALVPDQVTPVEVRLQPE